MVQGRLLVGSLGLLIGYTLIFGGVAFILLVAQAFFLFNSDRGDFFSLLIFGLSPSRFLRSLFCLFFLSHFCLFGLVISLEPWFYI